MWLCCRIITCEYYQGAYLKAVCCCMLLCIFAFFCLCAFFDSFPDSTEDLWMVDMFAGKGAIHRHWSLTPRLCVGTCIVLWWLACVKVRTISNRSALRITSGETMRCKTQNTTQSYAVLNLIDQGQNLKSMMTSAVTWAPCWMLMMFMFQVWPAFTIVTTVTLRTGFALALQLVLRLCPGALMSLGPPCCSYSWLNMGTSKRSVDNPYGDVSLPHVVMGNLLLRCMQGCQLMLITKISFRQIFGFRLMARACILALVATVRGAYFILEQPWSSYAKCFPPLVRTLQNIDRYIMPTHQRLFLWSGCISMRSNSYKGLLCGMLWCSKLDGHLGPQILQAFCCLGQHALVSDRGSDCVRPRNYKFHYHYVWLHEAQHGQALQTDDSDASSVVVIKGHGPQDDQKNGKTSVSGSYN